ncbi:MAG: N-acetylmuramoyl-L-alanine amidase [Butyrivibrio sp.]|nr:N-acetylmuramoyl-L-alanine amidase [Acetatifactor muris]MCM1560921.1 N-acetylmuramoyl-L-alanine amidase [Butyrivibrio sp.]
MRLKQSDKEKKGKSENMAAVCVTWTFLCLTCMAVMLMFAADKAIVIADVSQDPSGVSVNPGQAGQQGETAEDKTLVLQENDGMQGSFCVPLPKGTRAENVTMENRYVDRELLLYIQGGEEDFYEENYINGDVAPVLSAQCEVQEGGVLLKIGMSRVLEYRSTMDSSGLTINWYEPDELYDYIVVLDPAGEGNETGIGEYSLSEKDVTLQVARQIQKQFNLQNVRLYCVGTEDRDMSSGERLEFAEEVEADLYVRLSAGCNEADAEAYGITGFYNEDYYIPGFGNPDWADILTREVTIAASNRAVGLKPAAEESILRQLKMPAAEISLGFLSNPKEEYLLGQESYREKLAEGFVSAISKAVDALEL